MRAVQRVLATMIWAWADTAQSQGAQTEIEWLEEIAADPEPVAAPAASEAARSANTNQHELRLEPGASLWSRYELRRNYDALGVADARIHDMDAIAYRARFSLRTTPLQLTHRLSVDVAFVPQASGFWGPSGKEVDAALGLHEGYVRPRFGERSFVQVGRFEMSYGDEWLISANDWHETGRAFDGLRIHVQPGNTSAFFDLFGTLLNEGTTLYRAGRTDRRIGTGDQMLFGAYVGLGSLVAEQLELDLYALLLVAPRTHRNVVAGTELRLRREAASEATLGMRVEGRAAVLDYRLEGGIQVGDRVRLDDAQAVSGALAGAVDAELGFNLQGWARLAFSGQFASGDDPSSARDESWADRYSQPHKWLGFSDVIRTRTNVLGPGAFLTARPIMGLEMGAQAHFLFLHRALEVGQGPPDGSSGVEYAGTEVDGFIDYAFGGALYIRAEYALFIPNTAAYGAQNGVHYLGTQFGFDYGRQVE